MCSSSTSPTTCERSRRVNEPVPESRAPSGAAIGGAYTDSMKAASLLESISLEPNPTIEAYKKDIDRTLLRENLRLTTTARVEKMMAALRFAEAVKDSRVKAAQ